MDQTKCCKPMKKSALLAVGLVLLSIVAAAGCTSPLSVSNSTSTSQGVHDSLIEKFIQNLHDHIYGNRSVSVKAWKVTWPSNTEASILYTVKIPIETIAANTTITAFTSTSDANNSMNSRDLSNYSLASTNPSDDNNGTYAQVTGHQPTVFQEYNDTTGGLLNPPITFYEVIQTDNLVMATSARLSDINLSAASSSTTFTTPPIVTGTSTRIPTPTPSATPSAIPSVTPKPTPTPTTSPTPSAKIATSIAGGASFNSNPTITRGSPVSWGFIVTPTGTSQVLSVPVSVVIDGRAIGTVTPVSGGTETIAYSLTAAQTNSLAAGQHTLTVSFAGDSTYQPTVFTTTITVT
jgi:hypothetical protein